MKKKLNPNPIWITSNRDYLYLSEMTLEHLKNARLWLARSSIWAKDEIKKYDWLRYLDVEIANRTKTEQDYEIF